MLIPTMSEVDFSKSIVGSTDQHFLPTVWVMQLKPNALPQGSQSQSSRGDKLLLFKNSSVHENF